ncbi:MAG: hypothetical protein CMJ50_07615 [Planctomycetaceae bacterium]|nr:hypothetical protein [Planctomycetaceae bacterium]
MPNVVDETKEDGWHVHPNRCGNPVNSSTLFFFQHERDEKMLYLGRPMSVLALCGVFLFAASAKSAEPTENAALAYWQAFALLPTVDKDLDKLVSEAPTVKLDDRTKELVKKSKASLACMRRAASLPACDWGLEFSAGPHMVMPHLSKARQMARYACLHARQQLADGQPDKALKTIRDVFVLARHSGADDMLISILVQYAVEQIVIDTVSQELPNFDAKQLDVLAGYLDALPEGGSMTESLRQEQRVYVEWARRVVQNAKSDSEAVRQLRNIVVPADEAPGGKDVTRKQIAKWLDGTTKDYDEIHAIFDLPNDEFQPRWDTLVKRIRVENPYSSAVLPALKNVREVRDRSTATWALFRTAIAVQRDGKERLATIKDPFGGGPFQYKKLPAGFRLTSKFNFRGKQAELTVGPVAKR